MHALAGASREFISINISAIQALTLQCRIYEIQAFLIELVSNFEFSMTEETKKVRREPCMVMAPIVEDITKGARLPLKVTMVQRA